MENLHSSDIVTLSILVVIALLANIWLKRTTLIKNITLKKLYNESISTIQ